MSDFGCAVSRLSSREARGLAEEFGGDEKGTLRDGLRFGIEGALAEETKSGMFEPARLLGCHRRSDRFEGWRRIAAPYRSAEARVSRWAGGSVIGWFAHALILVCAVFVPLGVRVLGLRGRRISWLRTVAAGGSGEVGGARMDDWWMSLPQAGSDDEAHRVDGSQGTEDRGRGLMARAPGSGKVRGSLRFFVPEARSRLSGARACRCVGVPCSSAPGHGVRGSIGADSDSRRGVAEGDPQGVRGVAPAAHA